MNKYYKVGILAFILLVVALGLYSWQDLGRRHIDNVPENDVQTEEGTTAPDKNLAENDTKALPAKVLIAGVPFASQAPFGEWDDPRQQDGCEEASILMVAHWVKGDSSITRGEAKDEILELSAKADEMFGTYHDSSAEDTLKLYHAYYGYDGEVVASPQAEEIKAALAAGKLVAVPADGRKLGNPNFTGGGPDRHFLVIIGYDDAAGVFITHDPGTRNGANYRYRYDVLMSALVNYPTGDHKPLFKTDTAMIVFTK